MAMQLLLCERRRLWAWIFWCGGNCKIILWFRPKDIIERYLIQERGPWALTGRLGLHT